MSKVFTISERHLTEEIKEQAIAENREPIEVFEERLQAVSEWAEEVADGNEEKALVYGINEIWRTVDRVEGTQTVTDASDLNMTDSGRFDLRQKTK